MGSSSQVRMAVIRIPFGHKGSEILALKIEMQNLRETNPLHQNTEYGAIVVIPKQNANVYF